MAVSFTLRYPLCRDMYFVTVISFPRQLSLDLSTCPANRRPQDGEAVIPARLTEEMRRLLDWHWAQLEYGCSAPLSKVCECFHNSFILEHVLTACVRQQSHNRETC